MARKILVLGGTRFFGKRLVKQLLEDGDSLTVASRNPARGQYGPEVRTLIVDRESPQSLEAAIGNDDYDLVYDQICYSPSAADDICRILKNRVRKLVFTSTQAVYPTHGLQREEHFDASKYPAELGYSAEFEYGEGHRKYGEGKRRAEAIFAQRAEFDVVTVRLPYVLGADDYEARTQFHVDRVKNGQSIAAKDFDATTSFITSEGAAEFLAWIAKQNYTGPINVCDHGQLSLRQILGFIEKCTGKSAILKSHGTVEETSLLDQQITRFMDNAKAARLGFEFSTVSDWFPKLIRSLV